MPHRFARAHTSIVLVAIAVAALAVMGAAPGARAAVFTVTTTADEVDGPCKPSDCSLREAVLAANAAPDADTIVLPAGTYVLTGAGGEDLAATGDLDLGGSVTIEGAGAATTIIDGGGVDRIFDIVESATVAIRNVTLRNGHVPDGDTQGGGALLWNEPGTGKSLDLHLDGVVVTDNFSGSSIDGGGGIRIEQDAPGSSVVTITNSTISDNTMSNGDGGGLHLCCENLTVTISGSTISGNSAVEDPNVADLNGEGGGIYHCCNDTTLTLTDTTVSDNDGPTDGGGIFTCCGVAENTMLTLDRSTVSGNHALGTGMFQGSGGGIEAEGAVTLVNSTLSGNQARRDGGGIDNADVVVMRNVTIAENEGGRGGGFYEDGLMTTLANVLFASNVETPATPANCRAAIGTDPFVSEGGNLSSDATCVLTGTRDQTSIDPLIGPLAANGGPTLTHALAPASPAVDAGSDAACQTLDQRGFPRPIDGNGDGVAHCDVGAVERGSTVENCLNGIDDNGNGLVDCLDFDCAGQPTCQERCDDCVDDDGDGLVDRDDPDCAPRADGAGAGVADPSARGKLVVKCAGAVQKAGAKVVAARVKTLQACAARLTSCTQSTPGDTACLVKAGATCRTSLVRLDASVGKARATVVASCDPLTTDELLLASGLGAGAETPLCADLGVPALTVAGDVAHCLVAQHACIADRLAAVETPRLGELVAAAGLDPVTVVPCAGSLPGPAAGGIGPDARKLNACQRAVRKSDAKLLDETTGFLRRCAERVFACRQQKPLDAECIAKAACPKLRARIVSLASKLATAVAKKCNAPTLPLAELLGASGAGFQSEAGFCKALGVPSLGSVGALTQCLERHEQCRAHQLVERELPRLDELLHAGGVTFP